MGDLSMHFNRSEFACPCCGQVKIDSRLIAALEALRRLAQAPIRITSGYRCAAHNASVGGVPNSYHTKGMAADIICQAHAPADLAAMAALVPAFGTGGIGRYPTFTHVDVRGQAARWGENH